MEILGIKFAPLKIPLERCVQTLAVAAYMLLIIFGTPISLLFALYLLLFTHYRWLMVWYILWIWLVDKDVRDQGGRRSKWVRSWLVWRYTRDYFPLRLEKLPGVELDPNRNYLFCCFPHGAISIGFFNSFASDWCQFKDLFPHHVPHAVSLSHSNFLIPLLREIALGLGGISSSAKSIDYVLGDSKGHNVCALEVGGIAEAYYCKPGTYKVVLKERKGFVRRALKNGVSLVPVLSFGETDVFDQWEAPWLRKIQEVSRRWVGLPPIVIVGRGFFQHSFGLIPRRRKVTTVVGVPMEVPKIEYPTTDQVNQYHEEFVKRLSHMFEEHKHKYLETPEDTHLEITFHPRQYF